MRFPNVPGLLVRLLVDSQPLQEIRSDEDLDDSENMTSYVESVAGKNFSVEVMFERDFKFKDAVQCRIYIDGSYADGTIANKTNQNRAVKFSGVTTSNKFGQWFEQPFKFIELQTDDGSVKSAQLKTYKDLGTIQVSFQHVQRKGKSKPCRHDRSFEGHTEKVPEKGLKGRAITTQIGLDSRKPVGAHKIQNVTYPYGPIFAKASFLYRSRGDLQIEGIIPRTPSPTPLEDRDPDGLSLAEAQELVRRLRDQRAQQTNTIKQEVKMEKRDHSQILDTDEDELEIVGSSSKRVRVIQESGVDVLDLTDD